MKKCFLFVAALLMSSVIAAGIVMLPSKTVSADEDAEIKIGETLAVDYKKDTTWWFKYVATSEKMVEFSSSGVISSGVKLYKDNKDEGSLITDKYGQASRADWFNFSLTRILPAGTYYFKVYTSTSPTSRNDTKVSLKDVTDKTLVAEINETNFPDELFRNYVKENYDLRADNKLTKDEVKLVTKIDVQSIGKPASLEGIGFFTELLRLDAGFLYSLTSLDLSKNTKLEELYCNGNSSMTSLNVSGCKELDWLDCYGNKLDKLILKDLPKLRSVNCESSKELTSLDVSGCLNLYKLDCHNCALTSLDISNTGIKELKCANNRIDTIKLNNKIELLSCSDNQIKKLDLTKSPGLHSLYCQNNLLTKLDISYNPWLVAVCSQEHFKPDYNGGVYSDKINGTECYLAIDDEVTIVTKNDVSDKIVEINEKNFPDSAFREKIASYDIDNNGWLGQLEIDQLKKLNASGSNVHTVEGIGYLTELEELIVQTSDVHVLDLSKNTKLKKISCINSSVGTIKIGNCKDLRILECGSCMLLSSLDVSKNTKLEELYCYNNKLTSLDISNNPALKVLICHTNQISQLDISGCKYLYKAYKEGNTGISGEVFYAAMEGSLLDIANRAVQGFATDKNVKLITDKMSIDKKEATVVCGKTLTLKASLKNSTSKINWKSSDSKIATIDSNGKITAKMAGSVTITASADGLSVKCKLTVFYKDVTDKSDFWYAPTNYLTAKGVVRGYANQTEFRPANNCTRAQMVTFLYRLQGEPKTKSNKCKFDDVKSTDYFYKPVIWATEKGITTGVSAKEFAPQKVCTRAQTVTFLWRLAGKPAPGKNAKKFTDVNETDYYYKATLWASDMKILAGYEDGTFRPKNNCLRRQMVTFLYKYDKYVNGKG